jgi:hypothetical protein
MEDEQERPQGLAPDIEDIFRDTDGDEGSEAQAEAPATPQITATVTARRSRRLFLGLAFGLGLLLGWLVIGWWLWPVQWANSDPWHLAPQYQRTFVTLVAEEYWRTSDVLRANQALAGWDRKDLANLLTAMKNETTNAETRQHLVALGDALEMPGTDISLASSLLSQKGLLVGILFSAVPLVIAIGLVVSPLLRKSAEPSSEELATLEEQPEEQLEELLAGVQIEDQPDQEGQQQQPAQEQELEQGEEPEQAEQEGAEELATGGLGDLLNLFEEEDTSLTTLEAFCKGMADVGIEDLLGKCKQVSSQIHRSNDLRAYETGNPG